MIVQTTLCRPDGAVIVQEWRFGVPTFLEAAGRIEALFSRVMLPGETLTVEASRRNRLTCVEVA